MTSLSLPIDLDALPEIDLRQFLRLTDDTGMLQHATFAAPDHHHGYCIDDNCRALIASLIHASLRGHDETHVPLHRYLAFISYALNPANGRFRNFMGYDRRWLEEVGSEDSHARTLWALGEAACIGPNDSVRGLASRLFQQALGAVESFPYIRSWAFALLGLARYLEATPDDAAAAKVRDALAEKLHGAYRAHAAPDWPWWEDTATYDNAKLPHALLVTGASLGDGAMVEDALTALRWIVEVQTAPDDHLSLIGNDGWYVRGGTPAQFDQQPLEAHAVAHACLAAAEITGDAAWVGHALRGLGWFLGANDLGVPLYDKDTGGGHDGLTPSGVNSNQGAESTLAYLLTLLELHAYRVRHRHPATAGPAKTIGYGIVGASDFAAFCLESYAGLEGIHPVAVWSRTDAHARAFSKRHGIACHDTFEALLADESIRLVHIATVPSVHADQAVAALQAGKHVLTEKPLATTLEDGRRMLQAAAETGRRLGINFMMRHSPLWEPVKSLIECGLLGAPLRGQMMNCAGDDGLPDEHWFWDETLGGGIFVEHGVHFFDLVGSWLGTGQVDTAYRCKRPDTQCVDQVGCDVRYGVQTSVGFYHGFHQSHHLDRQSLRLIFEQGELLLHGWVADTIELLAVLSEADAERLAHLFPEADIEIVRHLDGAERTGSRRTGQAPVDAVLRLVWQAGADKQAVYAQALRDRMEDFLRAVHDPSYSERVTAKDGFHALELACNATRLAKGVSP